MGRSVNKQQASLFMFPAKYIFCCRFCMFSQFSSSVQIDSVCPIKAFVMALCAFMLLFKMRAFKHPPPPPTHPPPPPPTHTWSKQAPWNHDVVRGFLGIRHDCFSQSLHSSSHVGVTMSKATLVEMMHKYGSDNVNTTLHAAEMWCLTVITVFVTF